MKELAKELANSMTASLKKVNQGIAQKRAGIRYEGLEELNNLRLRLIRISLGKEK